MNNEELFKIIKGLASGWHFFFRTLPQAAFIKIGRKWTVRLLVVEVNILLIIAGVMLRSNLWLIVGVLPIVWAVSLIVAAHSVRKRSKSFALIRKVVKTQMIASNLWADVGSLRLGSYFSVNASETAGLYIATFTAPPNNHDDAVVSWLPVLAAQLGLIHYEVLPGKSFGAITVELYWTEKPLPQIDLGTVEYPSIDWGQK